MAFNVRQWLTNNTTSNEIFFLFQGEVSSSLIADSLEEVEAKVIDTTPKIRKKIYNVLVECLQNLYHHSHSIDAIDTEIKGPYAACILRYNSDHFQIVAGNFINNKQKGFLEKHLTHINSLNDEELKGLYKEILNNQEFSEKGGGGLGMVDMCRKSGSKLEFKFTPHTEEIYFFELVINIIG